MLSQIVYLILELYCKHKRKRG